MNFKFLPACFLLALLAGCGGKTAPTSNEVVEFKPDRQLVVGYWTPLNAASDTYEFFFSPTEPPYSVPVYTGRIWQGGIVVNLFSWDLRADGAITVRVVSPTCMQRPLNLCPAISSKTIVAKGSSVQDSSWTISSDDNLDGITDSKVTDIYHRADINLSNLAQGEFFLTHSNNKVFDTPIIGSVEGSTMSIRLDDFDSSVTLSAESFNTLQKTIQFTGNATSPLVISEEFFVTGSGYIYIPVKKWYENVALSASDNGEYTLSYELHRKVQVPPEIDANLVQIGTYEVTEKKSMVTGILNKFVTGIPVQALQKFYVSMELDFDQSDIGLDNANAGNELLFSSGTAGTVGYTYAQHLGVTGQSRNFNWVQRPDGAIVFNVANYGVVTLRFIQAINGGYQVLYSKPDGDYGTVYRVRDFVVEDDVPALNEQALPGRYRFTSISPLPNGTHEYEVTFHLDKTVTGVVGGYWFQDTNGDIVSFECTDAGGVAVRVYADCVAALDDTSKVSFAHVRRIRFRHKDGNNYQSKYDSSVYGGRFTAQGDPVSIFSLTYRWVRVGDETDD